MVESPEGIDVRVTKPPLPTLWIDTSVGIKLAKVANGEVLGEEAKALSALKEIVIDLTLRRRVLCVQSDQADEYAGLRLGDEVFSEFNRLTLGIRMERAGGIKEKHSIEAMMAYVAGKNEVALPYELSFHRDPMDELAAIEELGWFVVVGPPAVLPLMPQLRESRRKSAAEFETWRQENLAAERTFEQQFASELQADARAYFRRCIAVAEAFSSRPSWTPDLLLEVIDLGRTRQLWEDSGGRPSGIVGLTKFYASPVFAALPMNQIAALLWADLLTGNEKIHSGDPGDVALLPFAIPISHFVLIDQRMERRVKRRGIDARWGTKVFSMRTLDALMQELAALA